ncbi:hypothetical protein EVAR_72871_1 [Eumeta japonica]|uniref:Uncharacterized protein n=1 Tax=Eumeta variegata TaxID=151549 RepID=A0A4C2AE91_EUMVA|nr:hypothetical protein EVAR_72871_1 [Eumeta japonica]
MYRAPFLVLWEQHRPLVPWVQLLVQQLLPLHVIAAAGAEPATLFTGSIGLRLPAPVGVNVGVVPIDASDINGEGESFGHFHAA